MGFSNSTYLVRHLTCLRDQKTFVVKEMHLIILQGGETLLALPVSQAEYGLSKGQGF